MGTTECGHALNERIAISQPLNSLPSKRTGFETCVRWTQGIQVLVSLWSLGSQQVIDEAGLHLQKQITLG